MGRLFTRENAAEMGRRSIAVQAQRRAERRQRQEALEALLREKVSNPAQAKDTFVGDVKTRIRKQIDETLTAYENERDAKAKEKLSAALARLLEAERKLDMRPAPANVRPSQRSQRTIVAPDPD
jgi:hypothetical protein